jgi:hypothetical protein
MPPEQEGKATGLDALIDGYCYYPPGVWIPTDSKISFYNEQSIYKDVEYFLSKTTTVVRHDKKTGKTIATTEKLYPGYPREQTEEYKKQLITDFTKCNGYVKQFTASGKTYIINYEVVNGSFKYKWYADADNELTKDWYPNPKWLDKRSDYQRFVDEWGTFIQVSLAIGTIVAGFFTGGATWFILTEIAIEGITGVATGLREIQKGDYVGAGVSFTLGFLPILKTKGFFAGIDDEVGKSLAKSIAEANFTNASTVDDYIKFVEGLGDAEKMVLSKMLKQSEFQRNIMLKEVAEYLGKGENYKNMVKSGLKEVLDQGDVLTKIPFFQRMWVRELGSGIAVQIIGMLIDVKYGTQLNDLQIQSMEQYLDHMSFSPEQQKVFTDQILTAIQTQDEVTKYTNYVQDPETIKKSRFMVEISKSNLKMAEIFAVELNKYMIQKEQVEEEIKNKKIQEAIQNGYVNYSEIELNEVDISIDPIIIGDMWFVKKLSSLDKKINDLPKTDTIPTPKTDTIPKKIDDDPLKVFQSGGSF